MRNLKSKNIIIITESYPYISGEQFLYNEFMEMSKYYDKIYIFPLKKHEQILPNLPQNFNINNALNESKPKSISLVKNIWFILYLMYLELIINRNSIYFFKNLKYNLSHIKQAINHSSTLSQEFKKYNINADSTFLSTWMNIGSLTLSFCKYKNIIESFSFRVNGYDIFDFRHKGNYMPFQAINYKLCKKVIVLSQAGLDYIKKKNIFNEKLVLNYSGIYDQGTNPFNKEDTNTIVSCSGLIKLKRVDLIVQSLALLKGEVNWVHFGDGPELDKVKQLCATLPKQVNVKLYGKVSHQIIIDFYKNNSVNLFLHLSKTEGLGMATIEAQSFGIPAISCDVGGVSEVVTPNSGILIPERSTPTEVATTIDSFLLSELNTKAFRKKTKDHFKRKFNIKENLLTFIKAVD